MAAGKRGRRVSGRKVQSFRSRASLCRKSLVCARYRDIGERIWPWRGYAVARLRSLFSLPLPSSSSAIPPASPQTYGLVQFAVPVQASLEDTHRTSYVYTRVYTPRTSQISTLREHTNKPANHACICSMCDLSPCSSPRSPHCSSLFPAFAPSPPLSLSLSLSVFSPSGSQCPMILVHSNPRDLELSHARTRVFDSGKKCTEVYEILWQAAQTHPRYSFDLGCFVLKRKALFLRGASIKPITQWVIIV